MFSFFSARYRTKTQPDRSEIFIEASLSAFTPNKTYPDEYSSHANSEFNDFQNLLGQMLDKHRMLCWPRTNNFEHCTSLGPPNRRSNRAESIARAIRRRFSIFSTIWTPNAMLTTHKQFRTLCVFRTCRFDRRIGTELTIKRSCCRFPKFHLQDGHRIGYR